MALRVPSSETWTWYFLPVLSSTTVNEPLRFPGGWTVVWAETQCGSRVGENSIGSSDAAARCAESTAKRLRAVTGNSVTLDIFLFSFSSPKKQIKLDQKRTRIVFIYQKRESAIACSFNNLSEIMIGLYFKKYICNQHFLFWRRIGLIRVTQSNFLFFSSPPQKKKKLSNSNIF